MLDQCRLTVLMAVYNEHRFVRTCIDSMLAQTYSDFRFLIVDDASTDDTREIIRSYDDPRIELVCLEQNVGQTGALNVGLRQTETPWIARMDADDFSAPTRLEEQMKVLDANPSLSCVGTWGWTFREEPEVYEGAVTPPEDYEGILHRLLWSTPIIHGTMIASTKAMLDVGAYDDQYRYAADIEMYDRLLAKYTAINIPEKLLGIRYHDGQGQRTMRALQEIIDIHSRRLESGRYSQADAGIIRKYLSRQHIVLGRQLAGKGRLGGLLNSLTLALRLSPKTFFPHLVTIFLGHAVPERHRTRLKRVLLRIFSPVKATSN